MLARFQGICILLPPASPSGCAPCMQVISDESCRLGQRVYIGKFPIYYYVWGQSFHFAIAFLALLPVHSKGGILMTMATHGENVSKLVIPVIVLWVISTASFLLRVAAIRIRKRGWEPHDYLTALALVGFFDP